MEEIVYGVVGFALARKAIKDTRAQKNQKQSDAILLLAHGTPDTLGEMAEYLRLVTGGRGVPQHVVEELKHRYAGIGLRDEPTAEGPHLTRWTMRQAELLLQKTDKPVYVGMRNWRPFIADTVEQMKRDAVDKITAICLAPQNSRTSVGLYKRALMDAVGDTMQVRFIAGWATHPLLIQAFEEKMRTALHTARALHPNAKIAALFTAHAVPCRTIQASANPVEHHGMVLATEPDTYAIECKQTAAHVAGKLRDVLPPQDAYFSFQSQGMSGGPWLGPTVEDTLAALQQSGYTHIVMQPIGFVCDHVEILYDIDIAFQQLAHNLGITLSRAESLNESPTLIAALADIALHPDHRSQVPPSISISAAEIVTHSLPEGVSA
ncbi:MAG: ferrochelatase [Acidobacteria bacterium]|nr:ferrochelatase [Acidobacteriota bacterium]